MNKSSSIVIYHTNNGMINVFHFEKKISHSVVGRLAIGAKVTGFDTSILMILMIW